jgi:hypothetical protein
LSHTQPQPKKRNSISNIVFGQAITEGPTVDKVLNHLKSQKQTNKKNKFTPPFKQVKQSTSLLTNNENERDNKKTKPNSQEPSTSGLVKTVTFVDDSDSDDFDVNDEDLCCVCKCFSPPWKADLQHIVIVNWGQCSKCLHWTHLAFCSPVRTLRRHSVFYCPHCDIEQ